MGDPRSISELLRDAESLTAAVVALTGAYPALTIDSLLAAERAEILELGWAPSPAHRDCGHLVTIAALLAPVGRAHGNLPVVEAFHRLAQTGHARARAVTEALGEMGAVGDPPRP